jgi:hypothetical protein
MTVACDEPACPELSADAVTRGLDL